MAPRETENKVYAKFWSDQQRELWYVMVFSGVVNNKFPLHDDDQKVSRDTKLSLFASPFVQTVTQDGQDYTQKVRYVSVKGIIFIYLFIIVIIIIILTTYQITHTQNKLTKQKK